MPSQYARLPTSNQQDEMNAAFDDSDDERDDVRSARDTAPLLNRRSSPDSHPLAESSHHQVDTAARPPPAPPVPGGYNFEFDYPPPPGSPPPITGYGNSNGYVPIGPILPQYRKPNVFRRALGAVLPSSYTRDSRGGGVGNDGVFSNMSAKPGGPASAGGAFNGTHFSPEEVQKEAPPSYASAQADAVPPYWETTVMTPNAPNADGEIIVDGLPTGSLFSFLWNLLVSMSFQFVGFLLTFLLHTTHAAKYGSRAGLGVTLIQYGFYLRQRLDENTDSTAQDSIFGGWPATGEAAPPLPTFATPDEAAKFYRALGGPTNATATPTQADIDVAAAAATTSEWVSFMLMTVGWFILITSLLGFWRVKRWERGVRLAAEEAANPRPPPSAEQIARDQAILASLESVFGIMSNRVTHGAEQVRTGLGLPDGWHEAPGENQAAERDRPRFHELTRG